MGIEENRELLVKTLLKYHADPNARDRDQATPLHRLAWTSVPFKPSLAILELLLEHGAATMLKDKKSYYPIDYVQKENWILKKLQPYYEKLIDYGANVYAEKERLFEEIRDNLENDDEAEEIINFLKDYSVQVTSKMVTEAKNHKRQIAHLTQADENNKKKIAKLEQKTSQLKSELAELKEAFAKFVENQNSQLESDSQMPRNF